MWAGEAQKSSSFVELNKYLLKTVGCLGRVWGFKAHVGRDGGPQI